MINLTERVRCPWCYKVHTVEEWDNNTYAQCTNRQMKRAYTHLTNEKAFKRVSDTQDSFFLCPSCNKWSRGSQLAIVDTKDENLLKLGNDISNFSIKKR